MTFKSERRSFILREKCPPDIFKIKEVNKDQAAQMLLYLSDMDYKVENPLARLTELGMIQKSSADRISKMPKFNNAAWFMMLHDYIDYRAATSTKMTPPGPHID